ncbi:MAG TPA: sn-glycerol-3-phosphate ABC transporter ATP-binding protein UgpC [Dehalococcoidia bacterium]
MARVYLEHVTKRFEGGVVAVNDLSLEIRDQEFLVLVGPSGCGKSTALRMIAGLEQISDGSIYIGERRVNEVPPRDRDIAMVFQSYALYPHMSVYDNMAFGLKLRHVPKREIQTRVQEAAKILSIEPLLKRKPRQLSGGQRQRVALGRAIVREPQAFLMDEPLSNLDAKLRVETRAQIVKLHHRLRTTTIYVTHDQVEAMTMGDRIAVMRDGILQQLDTPQALYDRPANIFVAGFIGSPTMNMLPMGVHAEGGEVELVHDEVRIPVPGSMAGGIAQFNGREITVGLRPEDISDHAEADWVAGTLPAVVDVLEPLGSEAFLYGTVNGQTVIARVNPRTRFGIGDRVQLQANMNHLHVFDPETGANLLHPAAELVAAR